MCIFVHIFLNITFSVYIALYMLFSGYLVLDSQLVYSSLKKTMSYTMRMS